MLEQTVVSENLTKTMKAFEDLMDTVPERFDDVDPLLSNSHKFLFSAILLPTKRLIEANSKVPTIFPLFNVLLLSNLHIVYSLQC